MGGQQFFQEDEADQILRLAASKSSVSGALSREQLLATAAELGISPEAVMEAEAQVVRQREETAIFVADREEFRKYRGAKQRDFLSKLATYILILFLFFRFFAGEFWILWVAGFWGLSLLKDAFRVYAPESLQGNAPFEKWRKRNRSSVVVTPQIYAEQGLKAYVASEGKSATRIGAIKAVRKATSMELRMAKDYVDDWNRRNPGQLS